MDTFSRESVSDLFVAGEEEVSIVVLKYGDNLLATWQRNKGNSLSFEGMVDLLSSEARVCFFQKSSEDHKGKSQHKIIIPIGEEKAIEIIGSFYSFHVGRFTELFAYSICQAKEIRFLKEPIEDTKQSVCQIILSSFSDKIGTNDITFRELYTEVDSLNIPLSEINKEKDKEIWQKYVEALKKIVKQKEQVWKIREIGSPYVEKKDSNDRLIDIHVENQDKHFEMELKELFEDELKYCSVKNDLAFIEFKTYRKLDQESSDQLNDLAIIYCYDIVKNSPKHRIDGEIRFKYTDSQSRGEILSQVKTVLAHDYGILITINKDGSTDILEKDFPHIQKVIEDTFKDILELQRDNHIQLKVTFKEEKITIDQKRDFKTAIDIPKEVNFDISNSIVTITTENAQIYNAHVDKIKHLFPNVILESRPYRPTFFLRCKTDLEPYRQSIIGKIRNDIGQSIDKVEYKVLERHTKLRLSYQFCTESEREEFKQLVTTVCTKYEHLVEYPIENNEGTTTYELKKNEQAEREKEKEINDNLRRSMFIYLTPEEYEILNDPEREGNDITTEKGEKIGALCSKKGDRLKFRIRDSFDDLLNGKENERLDINEIRKGYIKPIFPGELVNIDRMIRAMEKVTNPGGKSEHFFSKKRYPYTIGYPANYNLPQFLFDPRMAREPSEEEIKNEQNRIKKNLNEPLLEHQPKQLEAVSKSVITKDMALIQGPPGTGKTTVIAEIMWQILSQNPDSKILLTSQTHLAVDNALERLKGKKIVRPIRIGNTEKFEDEGKAYSKDRIEKWCNAIPRSEIEKQHSDNAIHAWINNIATQCEDNPKYQKAINQWKKGLMEKELSIKKKFSEVYINYANVFAATCSECGSKKFGDIFNATFLKEQPRQETSKEP
ncbi:MAG: AAA family ATPase, partial [Tannerellaceae bacterium]|nr:AAA family ATPase [Tannerellaceae bacterium]